MDGLWKPMLEIVTVLLQLCRVRAPRSLGLPGNGTKVLSACQKGKGPSGREPAHLTNVNNVLAWLAL